MTSKGEIIGLIIGILIFFGVIALVIYIVIRTTSNPSSSSPSNPSSNGENQDPIDITEGYTPCSGSNLDLIDVPVSIHIRGQSKCQGSGTRYRLNVNLNQNSCDSPEPLNTICTSFNNSQKWKITPNGYLQNIETMGEVYLTYIDNVNMDVNMIAKDFNVNITQAQNILSTTITSNSVDNTKVCKSQGPICISYNVDKTITTKIGNNIYFLTETKDKSKVFWYSDVNDPEFKNLVTWTLDTSSD